MTAVLRLSAEDEFAASVARLEVLRDPTGEHAIGPMDGATDEAVADFIEALLLANPRTTARLTALVAARPADAEGVQHLPVSEALGELTSAAVGGAPAAGTPAQRLEHIDDLARIDELHDLTSRLLQAERASGRVMRAGLRPPTTRSLTGLVAKVLSSGADRWTVLAWAERKLATYVLLGELARTYAAGVLDDVLTHLGETSDPRDGDGRLVDAAGQVIVDALNRASGEATAALGEDFVARVDALVTEWPAIREVAYLDVVRDWMAAHQAAAVYG